MISVLLLLLLLINVACYDHTCQICQATPANSLLQIDNEMQTNDYWIVQSMMRVVCQMLGHSTHVRVHAILQKWGLRNYWDLFSVWKICTYMPKTTSWKIQNMLNTHAHTCIYKLTPAFFFILLLLLQIYIFSINHHLSIGMIFLLLWLRVLFLLGWCVNGWCVCVMYTYFCDNL